MKHSVNQEAVNTKKETFDATYFKRYSNRNRIKVKAIIEAIGSVDSMLDIGCNEGYVIAEFLNQGLAQQGHGIELNRSVVREELLNNDRFDLFEGDVTDFQFERAYDAIVFNAVHHHVFGKYGRNSAWKLFNNVVDHCGSVLIFETGHLEEKGTYYWKDAIGTYYTQQDDYINNLFATIGPRLKDVTIIERLAIHGIERPLYRIELHPLNGENDVKAGELQSLKKKATDQWSLVRRMNRTIGSQEQDLVEKKHSGQNPAAIFEGTEFSILRNKRNEELAFAKRFINDDFKLLRELRVLDQVDHPRVVNYCDYSAEFGIVFPYVEYEALAKVDFAPIVNKVEFKSQVKVFFSQMKEAEVETGILDLDLRNRNSVRKCIDIIDFNINNFLVKVHNAEVIDWCVVDMEYYSNRNFDRNERHLKQIMSHVDQSVFAKIVSKIKKVLGVRA